MKSRFLFFKRHALLIMFPFVLCTVIAGQALITVIDASSGPTMASLVELPC